MKEKPDLQVRLMEAFPELTDADFDYHASDLYVRSIPELRVWLRLNYRFWKNVRSFVSQLDKNQLWLDIPFAGYWPQPTKRKKNECS